jgi:glycosyltransferase involved in cell wall biosynthesis
MTDGAPRNGPAERPKLRVAYVDHVAQLSGGEIALVRLIDTLDEVEAHVILAEDGPLVARLSAAGVSVEVLPMRERTRDLRKDRVRPAGLPITALLDTAMYVFRLARRLRAIRPDLVHTNTLKAGIYGSLAARLAGVPAVWHVRDRIAADYLRSPAVFLLRALIATVPQGVIANSEATHATLWRPRADTRIIYSIVRDPVVGPPVHATRTPGGPFVVCMVGRIARWKGQHVFLEAFARAFRDGSETAALVGEAMFGEADEAYGVELREKARMLGIADRVDFRGFREDVWAELAGMDVVVHASITPEPFGQVIVEAMLAGVPVIASAGGGPGEILTNGVDGLLYQAGDVDALVEALLRLRGDASLRNRLSANARIRAERFSPQAEASNVMSLYWRVLERSARQRRR